MTKSPYYQGPASDHFDGTRFFNPWAEMPHKGLLDIWKWRRQGTRSVWPRDVPNDPRPPAPDMADGAVRATFFGHATTLIHIDGLNILLDPVFSDRVSPFKNYGPRRVRKPYLPLTDLPNIDAVFISHNHYDHMDVAALAWLAAHHHPVFVTPLGNARHLTPVVGNCPVISLDWHETHRFDNGTMLNVTPSQHWSRRGLRDINRDLWGGCMLKGVQGKQVYFSGDSGFHPGVFEDIFARHGAPDLAIVPIGAYEPRWFMTYSHMNPAEAVEVCHILQAKKAMGFHFETVQLTDEAFDAPRNATLAALQAQGLPPDYFLIPHPGDSIDV